MFLDSVAGLSDAQLNFKPAPGRWSIAEIAEHVALAEQSIFQATERALKSPAREKMAHPGEMDEKTLTPISDRFVKAKAPESFVLHNKFKSTAEAVVAFKPLRDAHIMYLSETQDPLREHFFKNPVMGDVDAFQWILFMSAQTERHVAQILEVKASPGLPQQ